MCDRIFGISVEDHITAFKSFSSLTLIDLKIPKFVHPKIQTALRRYVTLSCNVVTIHCCTIKSCFRQVLRLSASFSRYCDFLYGVVIDDASAFVRALPDTTADPKSKTRSAPTGAKEKRKKLQKGAAAKADAQHFPALAYFSEVNFEFQ